MQKHVYAGVYRVQSIWNDWKFRVRGHRNPPPNIVIVEIDSASIEEFGRWPWRRDYSAYLIHQVFEKGAKAVGVDILFSEPQRVIPEDLEKKLINQKLNHFLSKYDYDTQLETVFRKFKNKLVLAWASESICRPNYDEAQDCPIWDSEAIATHPKYFSKFSIQGMAFKESFFKTPMYSAVTLIPNLERFDKSVDNVGFVNDFRDSDGTIRKVSLLLHLNQHFYPSLPLALASLVKNEKIGFESTSFGEISALNWEKSGPISSHPLAHASLNFYGSERQFKYVSALDVMRSGRDLASEGVFKDAIVLIGLSAIALSDVVATPLDKGMPGVEVHATTLANLLENSFFESPSYLLLFLAIGLCLALPWVLFGQGFSASGTLLLGSGIGGILLVGDYWFFTQKQILLPSVFWVLQWGMHLWMTVIGQYSQEERKRKFLKTAFEKYVSPKVVDTLLKDPAQLSLGGKKQSLSILFSDIRGFTTYAESQDPKTVSHFLNEYLEKMTEIIFNHQGTLDKYVGDGIMAFWGAPLEDQDHTKHALEAALSMVQSIETHQDYFYKKYKIQLKTGIAIHQGEVLVGNMGSSKAFSYTALGDNVNLASRLEGATKFFGVQVLASLETVKKVPGISYRNLGSLRVKG